LAHSLVFKSVLYCTVDVVVDASEDEDKESTTAAKENVVTSTDGRSSSTESSQKRQMSVREKAAAFLETTMKDSIC